MSNDATPQLHRMPGSVILAVVVLSLAALTHLVVGLLVLQVFFPAGVLLLSACIVNALLAVGLANRMRWAHIGATIWCGVVIIVVLLVGAGSGVAASEGGLGIPVLYIVVGVSLVRENTRLWCGIRAELRPEPLLIERQIQEEKALTYDDEVELIEDLNEYGLRAGMVGTVVDMRDDPAAIEVEFIDDRTETTALATLRPGQVRPVAEPRWQDDPVED